MPNNKSDPSNRKGFAQSSRHAPLAVRRVRMRVNIGWHTKRACYLLWWLVTIAIVPLATLTAQDIKLPEEYRPKPRDKGGLFFGSLASAARVIRLDDARSEFEVDGRGVAIAIIGTGINESENLPQVSRVAGFDRADEHGLGTFLAGMIGGRGSESGIAPRVELVSLNIVERGGSWNPERLVGALHALTERGSGTPVRAVLLAVSDGGHYRTLAEASEKYGRWIDPLRREIDQLRKNRMVVVAPAGDRQLDAASPGLAFPAILPNVVVCPAVAVLPSEDSETVGGRMVRWSVRAGQLLPTSQRPSPVNASDLKKNRARSRVIAAPGSVEFSIGQKNARQLRLRSGSMQAAAVVTGAIALEQQYHRRLVGEFAPSASLIEWMQAGGVDAQGSPESIQNARIAEKHLAGTYTQLDVLQTFRVMRTRLAPQYATGTPDPKPRMVEGRQFGDLSEVSDVIRLKEAIDRFKTSPNQKEPAKNQLTGNGTCVAILATGIAPNHPDFENRVIERVDFTRSNPNDVHGYGTFVAGVIAAGRKEQTQGNRGVAPGAKIVSVKVLDDSGGGQLDTMEQGLDWTLKNCQRLKISVVVVAGGKGQYTSVNQANDDVAMSRFRSLVQKLQDQRVVVIAPAGNVDGAKPIGMSFPAIIPEVFSVAALEFERASETQSDADDVRVQQSLQIASPRQGNQVPARFAAYSMRLPKETDLAAPGGPVVSSSTDPSRGQALSGTVTAAALTGGTALLVQDYYLTSHKELPTAKFVEDCLTEGAWYIEDNVSKTEFRRLDVLGAIRRCYTQSIGQQESVRVRND